MSKDEKKKRRRWWLIIPAYLIAFLILVLSITVIYLRSDSGRRYLTKKVNVLLNEHVFHKASIGDIHYRFPLNFSLSNIEIYDYRDTILLKAQTLLVDVALRPLLDSNVVAKNLILSHFLVNLNHYKEDNDYNYVYALKSSSAGKGEVFIKEWLLKKLILEEGRFRHNNYHNEPFIQDGNVGLDYNRIDAHNFNAIFDSITFKDSLVAKIKHLSLIEHSGFYLKELVSDFHLTDHSFVFDNTSIKTPKTHLSADIAFHFRNWANWKQFIEKVELDIALDSSVLNFGDLSYFAPKAAMLQNEMQISGIFNGYVNNFSFNEFTLGFHQHAFVSGSLQMKGLPEWDLTFIKLNLSNSLLQSSDLHYLLPEIELPQTLDLLGNITAVGNFTGFPSSFVANGNFNSQLGSLQSDIQLNLSGAETSKYKGSVKLNNFNLGKLTGNAELGFLEAEADVNGKGFTIASIEADMKGLIQRFDYKGYQYHNAKMNGKVAASFFKGNLVLEDSNANLVFDGTVNLKPKKPIFQFKSDIKNLDLLALNLWKDSLSLKGKLDVDFAASSIDDFAGKMAANNLRISTATSLYVVEEVMLTVTDLKDAKKWVLSSELVDAQLTAEVSPLKIHEILQYQVAHWLNHTKIKTSYQHQMADLDLNVNIKKGAILTDLIDNQLVISDGTQIKTYLSHAEDSVHLFVNLPFMEYQTVKLTDVDLLAHGRIDSVNTWATINNVAFEDSIWLTDYYLQVVSNTKEISVHQNVNSSDSLLSLSLHTALDITVKDSNRISIDTSYLLVDGQKFEITANKLFWIGLKQFVFEDISLTWMNECATISGLASIGKEYNVNGTFEHIHLGQFKNFMPEFLSDFNGVLNGKANIYSQAENLVFDIDARIHDIEFNGLDISTLRVATDYNSLDSKLALFANLKKSDSTLILDALGALDYANNNDLDLRVAFNNLELNLLDTLINPFVSDIDGVATGKLLFSGNVKNPKLTGGVRIDSTSMLVNYLNTKYLINDSFTIDNSKIVFSDVLLYDVNSQISKLNGSLIHNNFSQMVVDVKLESQNFKMLSTTEVDNEIYYGTAYMSGVSTFKGPLNKIYMNFDLKPEKGTKLFLPIEEDQGYTQQRYIRFVNRSQDEISKYQVETQGMAFDMNLDINPNAELQLIFDKQLGDIIKASGYGKMKISLSETGEFEMYGDYVIEEGSYLFTAFDLINKRFSIEKGSKVSWVGNPYDAIIDITASYALKANAYYLVSALEQFDKEQLEQFNKPLPVKAIAKLKGSLLKPEIGLSYKFQNDGTADINYLERELAALNLSQEEIDKQVVSLLVLNRFMPIYTGPGNNPDIFGSGINSGLGDLISNQVTYWLSSISDNLQVDFKYRNEFTGNEGIVLTEKELELALSASFFNDRIGVNYSYEFQQGYRPNTEITYRVTPEGDLKLKLFNRQAQNPLISQDSKTYGVGLFIKREFNSIKELFKGKKKQKEVVKDE